MCGINLAETEKEWDIGILITQDLKPSAQCGEAARRATAILTQISKSFLYRDKKVFLQLYKQFVRCHLEFSIPAWSPWSIGDMEIMEKVQRRAINMITGLTGRTYEEKLVELNMTTLRERRAKIDMIQTYKIINKVDDVETETWFNLIGTVERATRNTAYAKNIVLSRSKTETRKNFFSNRVANSWNALPTDVKESRTLQLFKTKLNEIQLT